MGSSSVSTLSVPCLRFSTINLTVREKPSNIPKISRPKTRQTRLVSSTASFWSSNGGAFLKSVPLAASVAILLWSAPGKWLESNQLVSVVFVVPLNYVFYRKKMSIAIHKVKQQLRESLGKVLVFLLK